MVCMLFITGCKESADVADKPADKDFKNLIADDLSNCEYKPGTWTMVDGVLASASVDNENIWTKDTYTDFILDLEFKVAKDTNSGVIYHAATIEGWDWVQQAFEVQIGDSHGKEINSHICGAIFDALAPTKNTVKPVGQWNHMNITVKGSVTKVVLNGTEVINMDVDLWDTANKNPDGSKNQYKKPLKDFPRSGVIGLQDHGYPVWYKNIKIRNL